jgi:hypothetical protein
MIDAKLFKKAKKLDCDDEPVKFKLDLANGKKLKCRLTYHSGFKIFAFSYKEFGGYTEEVGTKEELIEKIKEILDEKSKS